MIYLYVFLIIFLSVKYDEWCLMLVNTLLIGGLHSYHVLVGRIWELACIMVYFMSFRILACMALYYGIEGNIIGR